MSVFDPARPVKAARAVPIRELARAAGSLIDSIERNGEIFALSRYGRVVALLTPVPERTVIEFSGPGIDQASIAPSGDDIEVRPEWLEMGPAANDILLRAVENHPMPFSIEGLGHEPSKVMVARTRLELAGLVDRERGGNRLTPEGLATARFLLHHESR